VQLKSDNGRTALDLAVHVKHTAAEAVIRKHLAEAKLKTKATAEAKAKAGVEEESK
jgi:glycyl-tRNA synthetase (class II)